MFLPCLCLCFYCGDLLLHLPDQFGQLLLTFLLGGGVDVPSHALSVHNGGAAALPAAVFSLGFCVLSVRGLSGADGRSRL